MGAPPQAPQLPAVPKSSSTMFRGVPLDKLKRATWTAQDKMVVDAHIVRHGITPATRDFKFETLCSALGCGSDLGARFAGAIRPRIKALIMRRLNILEKNEGTRPITFTLAEGGQETSYPIWMQAWTAADWDGDRTQPVDDENEKAKGEAVVHEEPMLSNRLYQEPALENNEPFRYDEPMTSVYEAARPEQVLADNEPLRYDEPMTSAHEAVRPEQVLADNEPLRYDEPMTSAHEAVRPEQVLADNEPLRYDKPTPSAYEAVHRPGEVLRDNESFHHEQRLPAIRTPVHYPELVLTDNKPFHHEERLPAVREPVQYPKQVLTDNEPVHYEKPKALDTEQVQYDKPMLVGTKSRWFTLPRPDRQAGKAISDPVDLHQELFNFKRLLLEFESLLVQATRLHSRQISSLGDRDKYTEIGRDKAIIRYQLRRVEEQLDQAGLRRPFKGASHASSASKNDLGDWEYLLITTGCIAWVLKD